MGPEDGEDFEVVELDDEDVEDEENEEANGFEGELPEDVPDESVLSFKKHDGILAVVTVHNLFIKFVKKFRFCILLCIGTKG